MGHILLDVHSLLRWLVLIFGFWAVISAISGLSAKRIYSNADNKSNLFFMISCDLQLLVGLLLYFVNGWATKLGSGNMQEIMNDKYQRFFTVEHETMMIIALIVVHIGRSMVKKAKTDKQKFSKALIYFGVALLLILLAIPWPFRDVARPWLF